MCIFERFFFSQGNEISSNAGESKGPFPPLSHENVTKPPLYSHSQQERENHQEALSPSSTFFPMQMQDAQYGNGVGLRKLPMDGEFNRFRRRKWVWMMAVIDAVLSIMVMGRFFHYVSHDARISNTPPESELKDRITLLWTWFGILAAYVCQLLMAIALIISTQMNDAEIALGNCQLYIYGCHALNFYTFVETLFVVYEIFRGDFFHNGKGMAVLSTVCFAGKIMFRIAMFFAVKMFMRDLARPSCTCNHNRANHTAVTDDLDGNLLPRQSWPSR